MTSRKASDQEVADLVYQIQHLQKDSQLTYDQITRLRQILGRTETDAVRNVDPNFFVPSTDNQTTISQASELDGRSFDEGIFKGEFYRMRSTPRGKALIIQNDRFQEDNRKLHGERRYGSEEDLSKMECRFQEKGFETILKFNLTKNDTMDNLRAVVNDIDYNENVDCFACVILSHGNERGIEAVDCTMDVEEILSIFYASNCPSLAGKPKIFIFQCCRGRTMCRGLDVDLNVTDATGDDREYKEQKICIPDHADFLIVYASRRGYAAFRNTSAGSPFIIRLSEELENMQETDDIITVLTRMNHRFYDYRPKSAEHAENTQMPCFESTLTRKLKL